MAKKEEANKKLTDAFLSEVPANPALTTADKNYLRGLKRRGFTELEIRNIAGKASFVIPQDFFVVKPKKVKVAVAQPVENRPVQFAQPVIPPRNL